MFRTQTTATESLTDELELTLETLKDLTVTGREADGAVAVDRLAAVGRELPRLEAQELDAEAAVGTTVGPAKCVATNSNGTKKARARYRALTTAITARLPPRPARLRSGRRPAHHTRRGEDSLAWRRPAAYRLTPLLPPTWPACSDGATGW